MGCAGEQSQCSQCYLVLSPVPKEGTSSKPGKELPQSQALASGGLDCLEEWQMGRGYPEI